MRVAVLGGGLQGCCIAIELASAGVQVDLFDKNDRCLSQASSQNEGKIHLGYLYANDPSLCSARAMAQGASVFAPLLRRWIGDAVDRIPVSAPFHYVVHADSLLTIEEVEDHFRKAHAILLQESRRRPVDYFGADCRLPPERLSMRECAALFDGRRVAAAYRTPEIGIDPEALAQAVRDRLSSVANINCRLRAHVHGVVATDDDVSVEFETDEGRSRDTYDHVVNALWDGRLAVDRTAGVHPHRPWMFRVKHYLRLRAPAAARDLPSATIVLGAFGDVVVYGARDMYLSWYPAGLRGRSLALMPPPWPLTLDEAASAEIRLGILNGLREVVPAIASLTADTIERCDVKGGIIFAWGSTDIQDPASGLHGRHEIGVRSRGRYHTVDTGKLTTAPYFAQLAAERILNLG
jgi:glycine/D-amino acid oxidase-like deaminating enzyme